MDVQDNGLLKLEKILSLPIQSLGLKQKAQNALKFYSQQQSVTINTIGDITKINYLLFIETKGIGEGTANQISAKVKQKGIDLYWNPTSNQFKRKYNL